VSGNLDSLHEVEGEGQHWPWLSRLALAWIAGLVLGSLWPHPLMLAIAAVFAWLVTLVLLWRRADRAVAWSALVGIALIGGAWLVTQRDYVEQGHVARVIHDEPAIARVRGTVASTPRDVLPDQGAFGMYNYQGPGTSFELNVEEVDAGQGFEPASGALLLRIKQEDHRPAVGQRIEATGWLSSIGPTQNPGEFDYRAYLEREGISGRLSVIRRGNWHALDDPPRWTLTGVRREIGDAAARSLKIGMPNDSQRVGLLEALLLGRRTGDIRELSDSFRAVGLSHVLSISGAHLAILLLLVWAIGRLLIGRPQWVAPLVLAVLVLFLLAVPWRTPIVRAAVMAGVFCAGYGMGRRLTGMQMLSAAALIVLIWRPTDLFTAGFQLSFGVVGAILLFARPMSLGLMAEPDAQVVHPSAWDLSVRWLVDFLAMSLVAFLVAMPMVMYHFQLVSPLAVLLSLLALPVLTAVLAVGYLKILVGLVSPAVGSWLAVPLAWVSDSLTGLVIQSQRWPGASVELSVVPSIAWTLACAAVVLSVLGGVFRRRRVAMVLCVLVVAGWGWYEQQPRSVMTASDPPALALNMFAVGDGSCYLLRSGDKTLMFDCGSRGYWQIGERSIVPALRELGVARIDVMMLSHADLDHFLGALDVIDAVQVGEVLVPPDVMRKAADSPGSPAGLLVAQLRERGCEPTIVERGWSQPMGGAALELVWPERGYVSEKSNNNGLVLSVEVAGRRVLLNSDIEGEVIERLLAIGGVIDADVMDLAHHGSFVDESPALLDAVGPSVVLQSSGPRRVDEDVWAPLLEEAGVPRLWTDELGMVQLLIADDGTITWTSHRGAGGSVPQAGE